MSLFNNPNDIITLKNLICPDEKKNDSDTDVEEDTPCYAHKLSPACVAKKPVSKTCKKSPYDPLPEKVEPQPKSIEEWQEKQEKYDAELLETRQRPNYTYTYRQAVGTEDVFLQLGNRTGATSSCEDMILEILLPDDSTSIDKMGLNITETEIELSTNKHYLKMPLVHSVNVDLCTARFDTATEKLILTLRLVRELDFVNF